ncbi:Spy/CpxP family protein refolding chaperone [Methylobacillus caricis]|uniref:Spy/CpxP family protein refolding chaperone n=1 Tax=Methylobacillus caricis TaxID=1971611 RepID=UPI001D000F93|nr:Spy/CpxP family protein refolding chaperone [Methylobacillus caricis]MCB5187168.1 Spy/CpxP family protein refolding chaperone [Methylobacillus caricis]
MKPLNVHLKQLLVITGLLLMTFNLAQAEPGTLPAHGHDAPPYIDGHQNNPGFPGLPPHFSSVDLTEAQQDKIFDILHAQAPAVRNNFKQQHKLREALVKLGDAADFDQKKARILADQLGKLIADSILNRAGTEASIKALLTPDQLAKLEQAKAHIHFHHDPRPPMIGRNLGELLPPH